MLAIDSNVLVRVLVDDPDAPAQCQVARTALSEVGEVFVPQVVQIETVWVLARAYGLAKPALLSVLGTIADHPAFHLQSPEIFQAALGLFQAGNADFADCVILAESAAARLELVSFDRKLGQLAGVRLLTVAGA